MKWFNILVARLRALVHRERVIDDIDQEFDAHIELATRANVERGMAAAESSPCCRRSFGNFAALVTCLQVKGGG